MLPTPYLPGAGSKFKTQKLKLPFVVTAEKLLYGGDALARRDDGKTVFIPFAVPGDKLLVRTTAEKKNYIRAEIIEILTRGDWRVNPMCSYFGRCGGCHWQNVEYSMQVEAKRRILEELFNHCFPETRQLAITMQPCSQAFGYRSRARVRRRVDPKLFVGFFRAGTRQIEDLEYCPLFRPCLNNALSALRQIPSRQYKTNRNDTEEEINIACSEEENIWSISKNGAKETLLRRKVGDFTYNVAAGTFFQANDFMVDALVAHVMDCVCVSQNTDSVPPNAKDMGVRASRLRVPENMGIPPTFPSRLPYGQAKPGNPAFGSALDLFSGVGLFSLPLAFQFNTVTAVEYSRKSHKLCLMNAAEAAVKNLHTICADVAEWLNSQAAPGFDCVVLDPPRAGAASEVMERVGRIASKTIIYVSCDPRILARDLERLDMKQWRIVSIAGFDMFPQTYHFETVVHLQKWTR